MLRDVIENSAACANQADLEALMAAICSATGTRYVSYTGCGLTTFDASRRQLSNLPEEWLDYASKQNLDRCDPVYFQTKRRLLPYFWGNDAETESREVREFLNVAWDFGTRNSGVAIPVRGPLGDKGLLCVISEHGDKDWKRRCEEHLAELVLLAQKFHDAVVKIETANGPPDVELTPRECEVLGWAAQGKTAWETGRILGLSEGTVKFYIRNACKKLGVQTKVQAIARCVAVNRISA